MNPDSFTTDRAATGWARLGSIAGGVVVSGLILFGIAQAQKTSLGEAPAPPEELRAVALDSPPPPPPPPSSRRVPAEPVPPVTLAFDSLPTESGIVIATAPTLAPPAPRVPEIRFEFDLAELRPSHDRRGMGRPAHFQVEEVDRRPSVLYRVPPKVHSTSVRHLANPSVTLIFVVTANGIAEDIRVVEAPTRELGEIMAEAVREWKFRPAMKDGVRVSCLVQQSLFLVSNRSPF